jgi:hypothetical protein
VTFTYDVDYVQVSVVPVPEPSWVLLICGAAGGLVGWLRVSRCRRAEPPLHPIGPSGKLYE